MKVLYYPGRALSNWNDGLLRRRFDRSKDSRLWRFFDRIAGWMYVR